MPQQHAGLKWRCLKIVLRMSMPFMYYGCSVIAGNTTLWQHEGAWGEGFRKSIGSMLGTVGAQKMISVGPPVLIIRLNFFSLTMTAE